MAKRKYKSGVTVNPSPWGGGESEVVVAGEPTVDKSQELIRIHPWERVYDRSVYIEVGYFKKNGHPVPVKGKKDCPDDWTQSIIVGRDDFVEAVLAVFPELQRATNN